MAISIVRLGSPRGPAEGLRIGTVRRPPRGVRKSEYAARDFFDVWFPNLAPTEPLLKAFYPLGSPAEWKAFERRFRAEMKQPGPSKDLDLLSALSHHTALALGCYCVEEARCHRSILRALLAERGAALV